MLDMFNTGAQSEPFIDIPKTRDIKKERNNKLKD